MVEPLSEAKQQFHVHLKLNGDHHPTTKSQSLQNIPNINIPSNVTALEFPPDMSAASSTSTSSNRSAANSSHLLVNGGRENSPRFDNLAAGGFYFDRTPSSRVQMNGMVRHSPPRRELPVNVNEYQDNVLAARNHRIYAIDELSEVSGRSDLVALHERMRMEQVHEILANQERQARRDRPASRRPVKEVKVSRAKSPSPTDSPPYGVDSPPHSNRVSFRKCRILIPPNQSNSADDNIYSQAFDAFIFDLDLATVNHSMTSLSLSQFPSRRTSHHHTPQHPSNRFSRHSSDRMNSGYLTTGTSRIPSRSEAIPQKSNSSCCACFGLGSKVSERPSKNDWRAETSVRNGGGSLSRETVRHSGSEKDHLI